MSHNFSRTSSEIIVISREHGLSDLHCIIYHKELTPTSPINKIVKLTNTQINKNHFTWVFLSILGWIVPSPKFMSTGAYECDLIWNSALWEVISETMMRSYWMSWTGCLCSPARFVCWNLIPSGMVFWGETFGRQWGHESRALTHRISALIGRGLRTSSLSSLQARMRGEAGRPQPRGGL